MKKLLLLLAVFTLAITLTSCKDDNRPPVECTEGTTFQNGSCVPDTPSYDFGEAKLLGVDTTDIKPEEAKTQDELTASTTFDGSPIYLSTTFGTWSDVSFLENAVEILNIEYDGFFTLLIDIDNPNKDTILEIEVIDNSTGITNKYAAQQLEDLDEDGELDELFYTNRDNSTIYIGVKLPKDHTPGSQVSYTVKSITYLESGVVKYVQMDEADPTVTVNVEITNMVFGIEFDKDSYTYDFMRSSYDDVYVMLSVFNEKNVDFYSVDLTINGIEKTYNVQKLTMFMQSELNFTPVCPEPYSADYCESVIVQIPGEDIAEMDRTSSATTITNEFNSEEVTDTITVEVLGINSSAVKDTQVFDGITVPTFTFTTIQDSEEWVVDTIIRVTPNFQDITFDFTDTIIGNLTDINVRLYNISDYELLPGENCGTIIFGDYGYNNDLPSFITLTDLVTTVNFETGSYTSCAIFVDSDGYPINGYEGIILEFDAMPNINDVATPDITWVAGNEPGSYTINVYMANYLEVFDIKSVDAFNSVQLSDGSSSWRDAFDGLYVDAPFITLNVLTNADATSVQLKIMLYVSDDNLLVEDIITVDLTSTE